MYRNVYNRLIKTAKKNYFERELIKNQSNLKQSWKLILLALNRKPKKSNQNISELLINDSLINDPAKIASHFNNFFSTAPSKIVNEIPNSSVDCGADADDGDGTRPVPIFRSSDITIGEEEIFEALSQLEPKNSQDSNDLSMYFLKKIANELVIPLKHIFNLSIKEGVIPDQMKIARVIPIFKGGDPLLADNYRPIALLSNFSKILEKIMHNRLMTFLETNNILSASQFGFRKNHSTVHPMIQFSNFISNALNNKEHVLAVFCDLRKAFDTVDHKILLKKMKKIGITGMELEWFRNYLTNRKQYVVINGICSSPNILKIGVPQGSILGPLLFLLYINDLPICSELFTLLFADDTTLLASSKNVTQLFDKVNKELLKIAQYFRINKLALHPLKTKYILFSNSNDALSTEKRLFIDNNIENSYFDKDLKFEISRVRGETEDPAIKFLGLLIDPKFSFKHHVSILRKKLSSALYFLRSSKNILSQKALTSAYYSLFHCHLIYAIQIWSVCSQESANSLFKLQKKAIRLLNNAPYNSHTESLFKKCNILPLPKLIEYFKLQFMHQFIQGFLPISLKNTWTTNEYRNRTREYNNEREFYPLRNSNDLYIPPARLKMTEKHPYHSFPKLWSEFQEHNIKIQREKPIFNLLLKRHFIDNLQTNYKCSRLLCPTCHLSTAGDSDSE